MPKKRAKPRPEPSDQAHGQSDARTIDQAQPASAKSHVDTTRVGGRRRRELLLQKQPIPQDILLAAAKITKDLDEYFRETAPEDAQWLSLAASMIWDDAVDTSYALYEANEKTSGESDIRLDLSHLVSPNAQDALKLLAKNHPLGKRTGEVRKAYETLYGETVSSGPEIVRASGKIIIHEIRETLRDFGDISRAIAHNEELIVGMAEAGNDTFFADLGEVVKEWRRRPERFVQTDTSRIIFRAWLPLRLWECEPDGMRAEKRCQMAARVLRRPMPGFGAFLEAWRIFRSRVARPVSQAKKSCNLPR